MMMAAIERIEVEVFALPTEGGPESDGTLVWDETTMVLVRARSEGTCGLGYTYAHASAAALIEEELAGRVLGCDVMAIPAALRAMLVAVRNVGRPGIAACAISAVDIALWDLKARLLGVPLADLLGAARRRVPAYASGGFTSTPPGALERELDSYVSRGFGAVKIKVGRDPARDEERVRAARAAIGEDTGLFVDANGGYARKQALAMAERFAAFGVAWFEEPVSSDDVDGLRLLRDRAPSGMDIAAGEYGYGPDELRRLLEAGAVDVLQADASRALGVSGFMIADALCTSRSLPLSAHTMPAVHAHLGAAARSVIHVEHFHDHARMEGLLFEAAPGLEDGALVYDAARPGLGLDLDERAAGRLRTGRGAVSA